MTIIENQKHQITDVVLSAINKSVDNGQLLPIENININLEVPREKSYGDYSTNIAMMITKIQKKAPAVISQIIVSNMDFSSTSIISVDIAGAGFINFKLSNDYLYQTLLDIETQNENYGKVNIGNGEKIMVEFVSANPTGPMHMGNARGGALGDTLAEVLIWAGYDVTREFYVNDAGNQIEKFAISLEARYLQIILGENAVEFPEDAYHGEDIKVHAQNFYEINGDKFKDVPEEDRKTALVNFALPKNIDALKVGLENYRIFYNVWFRESELHESGLIDEIIEKLKISGHTYEAEDALWLKLTDFGLEKDEVLVRANGFSTYFAADIAYHYNKLVIRGFDKAINIWGTDHHGHVARMMAAMKAIGVEENALEIILIQLVRLISGGEVVRMSKRTGKAVSLNDLVEETGIDAARFFFNMRQAGSHMDFDLDLAVSQSNENPVFYVQYAHARICSILGLLAQENIIVPSYEDINPSLLIEEQELALIKKLSEFPEEIIATAKTREPSKLTHYAIDLASCFHTFYNACRVRIDDKEMMAARLKLVNSVRIVIANILSILKVEAPDKM